MRIKQPRQLIPVEYNRVVCAQLLLCDLVIIKIQHMGWQIPYITIKAVNN